MSKQSDRKLAQGYNENPVPRTCSTCEKYQSEFVTDNGCFGNSWKTEKNKKCEIGGFAVKKTATCRLWKLNERLL